MFTRLCRIAVALARKPYRIGLFPYCRLASHLIVYEKGASRNRYHASGQKSIVITFYFCCCCYFQVEQFLVNLKFSKVECPEYFVVRNLCTFIFPSVNYGSLKCRCNFKFEIKLISRLILNLPTSGSESCKDFNSFLLL